MPGSSTCVMTNTSIAEPTPMKVAGMPNNPSARSAPTPEIAPTAILIQRDLVIVTSQYERRHSDNTQLETYLQ